MGVLNGDDDAAAFASLCLCVHLFLLTARKTEEQTDGADTEEEGGETARCRWRETEQGRDREPDRKEDTAGHRRREDRPQDTDRE